jgi:hypothetical protein
MALMDGRARAAKELAYGSGITPQTPSSHPAKLCVRAYNLRIRAPWITVMIVTVPSAWR